MQSNADLEQYTAAINDYDKAIQLKPDLPRHIFVGVTKGLLKRTWAAKQDLQTALRLAENADDESLKAQLRSGFGGLSSNI